MASYLKETDRDGLPYIRKSGFIETTGKRITKIDDDFHRHRPLSPSSKIYTTTETYLHPRPPSPNRRQLAELQDQVRAFKDELRKKDALVQQLVSMDAIPKVTIRSGADSYRQDTIYLGDRHAVEHARSELAAAQVKNDKCLVRIKELESDLEAKEIKIREIKTLYETSKENESRLSALLESHRQQILGSGGKHLEEREKAETQYAMLEKRYQEMTSQLTSILRVDEFSDFSYSAEEIVRKMTDLVQENALLKGKIVTLHETLNNTELESKASRETIMRLVSEVGKEQKVATRFTSEVENLRLERDQAITECRNIDRENVLLRERMEACQKALDAAREELQLKEHRLSSIDREYRATSEDIRKYHTEASLFREQIANLLSSEISEEAIKRRVNLLQQDNRDLVTKVESMEERVKTLTEQLETQYELHKTASHRARKAESELAELEERLRSAEGELAAGDVLRDGFKLDKEKYLRALQRLGEKMKMDRISIDLGLDLTIDALITRAEQLVKLEQDAIADKSTHIYNLQRKVKSLKEQLESKDLHLDLLRKKMTNLEEKLLGKSTIEKERDGETFRVRKLEKLVEKLKFQLQDSRQENTNLKAQLLGSSDLKMRTLEQRKEIEELVAQVDELEDVRKRQSSKIRHLKEEVDATNVDTAEKRVVSENAVQALSSELRTTKNALNAIQTREKQLLDFRNVVARMLGLDMNTLAVPDYEIISRLEKLIQAHHTHAFTTMSMEEALADMQDGFLSGYEEYRQSVGSENSSIRRARERVKRKAARARARSLSPQRRDPRVY
ncbi:hypothetical protein FSP39_019476 [Pinctada imbricata]|uniref:Coiled-coil domain-containing protein 170 n=1 Tax=Pinctada imbricata TaxID=66713 RepID=A0AA88XXI1_PINIB|nr:hypothetical protein FSP39_019476 [Pinctada imbricata]